MKTTREENDAAVVALQQWSSCVESVARQYLWHGSDLEEMKQVGRLAVLKAIRDHDPAKGRGLKGLVWVYVRNAMRLYCRADGGLVHIPAARRQDQEWSVMSLDAPRGTHSGEGSWTLLDVLPASETDCQGGDEVLLMLQCVQSLPERERGVIEGLYFEHATILDLAAKLKCSRQRVEQIRNRGLELLRVRLLRSGVEERRVA